ncbi:GTP-dependent dephospho-CoA kinase family protein [Halarchaeum sp. CBA1220]|uniref:GTP-dependent dephospho-CoA kinase family protein n=1 Tax=Halarchaeum sp. CBA1220 TaxID=1853682 RepID=UPI000F3AA416|nr:GTP-dependent dephospho-CoA kinase family protein [Halarchaeum sp. CBA1220]QLC33159.1 GTP-dependent dephospho-CoA kinase family protein [Halarchaeum sp. CBA1220]
MSEAVATLPPSARASFKQPLGPVFTDALALLEGAGDPLIAVGDVVTAHLGEAGVTPHVAVVDGKTEREAVAPEVTASLPDVARVVDVTSEPGSLSGELVRALVAAIDADEPTRIVVAGEEDLATVPAVLYAPADATVVYGQPGEGMVRANVTAGLRERVRDLAGELETTAAFWRLVERA